MRSSPISVRAEGSNNWAIAGCAIKRRFSRSVAFPSCFKKSRRPLPMTSRVRRERRFLRLGALSAIPPSAQAVLALLLVAGLFAFSFQQLAYQWNWAAVYKYRAKFLQGWMVT